MRLGVKRSRDGAWHKKQSWDGAWCESGVRIGLAVRSRVGVGTGLCATSRSVVWEMKIKVLVSITYNDRLVGSLLTPRRRWIKS